MESQHPLDRRHLKDVLHRNEMIEGLEAARDWAKSHLEAVLIGALVLAAAVFGTYFFIDGQRQKAIEASKLLAEAQGIFLQAQTLPADQAAQAYNQAYAKYQALLSGYEGSEQAPAAHLGLANALLAEGKFQDAEREYASLDSRKAGDLIGALAARGRVRCLQAQGKGDDAKALEAQAAAAYPGAPGLAAPDAKAPEKK